MNETLLKGLNDKFGTVIVENTASCGMAAIVIEHEHILAVLTYLHDDESYDFDWLNNLTSVDYPDYFEIVYHLTSRRQGHKIAVKARFGKEYPIIDTVTGIWPGADFQEREVFDLMGIFFKGHKDLRRILMPDDFEGHPLRKDFKLPS